MSSPTFLGDCVSVRREPQGQLDCRESERCTRRNAPLAATRRPPHSCLPACLRSRQAALHCLHSPPLNLRGRTAGHDLPLRQQQSLCGPSHVLLHRRGGRNVARIDGKVDVQDRGDRSWAQGPTRPAGDERGRSAPRARHFAASYFSDNESWTHADLATSGPQVDDLFARTSTRPGGVVSEMFGARANSTTRARGRPVGPAEERGSRLRAGSAP